MWRGHVVSCLRGSLFPCESDATTNITTAITSTRREERCNKERRRLNAVLWRGIERVLERVHGHVPATSMRRRSIRGWLLWVLRLWRWLL